MRCAVFPGCLELPTAPLIVANLLQLQQIRAYWLPVDGSGMIIQVTGLAHCLLLLCACFMDILIEFDRFYEVRRLPRVSGAPTAPLIVAN